MAAWAAGEIVRLQEALLRVTEALDDAIVFHCNARVVDSAGWTQEDYDEWDAARDEAEQLIGRIRE